MMLIKSFVAPSAIDGVGVFTEIPLKKGDAVWRFEPECDQFFTDAAYEKLPPQARNFIDRYAFTPPDFPRSGQILTFDHGRYMNHSFNANVQIARKGGEEYYFEALRDIAPGEELTCDYRAHWPELEREKNEWR